MNPIYRDNRSRQRQNADRSAEYLHAPPKEGAPFSLYTEGHNAWDAPRLTLPGKVPHRMASGVVR